MLIAATSGRALAQSASRAGYLPLTVDFFCDLDTQEAGETELVEGSFAEGFSGDSVVRALNNVTAASVREPIGLVYGSGFENCPDTLQELGRNWQILGNSPDVVKALKDPLAFATLCHSLAIPHPAVQLQRPDDIKDWLRKARGGTGGAHVADASHEPQAGNYYYQRHVAGIAVSALFLADGELAQVVGFSRQWASPIHDEPFRYGGAIRPADLSQSIMERLAAACHRLTAATGLRGLNSADFLVEGSDFHLLEINPRPGATLDIFDDSEGWLFSAHIAACQGALPASPVAFDGYRAATVVYAESDIDRIPVLDWPAWTMDRQIAGSRVEAGWPLCTVMAMAEDGAATLVLLAEREKEMKRRLGGNESEGLQHK